MAPPKTVRVWSSLQTLPDSGQLFLNTNVVHYRTLSCKRLLGRVNLRKGFLIRYRKLYYIIILPLSLRVYHVRLPRYPFCSMTFLFTNSIPDVSLPDLFLLYSTYLLSQTPVSSTLSFLISA